MGYQGSDTAAASPKCRCAFAIFSAALCNCYCCGGNCSGFFAQVLGAELRKYAGGMEALEEA